MIYIYFHHQKLKQLRKKEKKRNVVNVLFSCVNYLLIILSKLFKLFITSLKTTMIFCQKFNFYGTFMKIIQMIELKKNKSKPKKLHNNSAKPIRTF